MSDEEIDKQMPKLTELELAIAIEACKRAGAVNAAIALSKHVTRLEIEIARLKKKIDS